MSDPPGIPRIWLYYTVLVGVFLVAVGLVHGILSAPIVIFAALEAPAYFNWVVLAFIGWSVLYVADVVQIMRFKGLDAFVEFASDLGVGGWVSALGLISIYLNVMLAISAVLAMVVTSLVGPGAALIVAVLYPSLELRLGFQGYSPGFMVLSGLLGVCHLFGALRDLSAEGVLESLRFQGQVPDTRVHLS